MVLQPNKPAPNFKGTAVVDGTFKEISLRDYEGKYLLIFFYPADFATYCWLNNAFTSPLFSGMFIIDGKGILRQITINDKPVGRSIDEAIRLLDAFQYVEKYGEVCPVNWKAGKKTIKPDMRASQDYFEEQAY
ncbi:Peroxiredoxin Prx4 [Fasciola gigantica]|uniref:thioredoxin-dependent peroxiredoxin n=1 Tax=Fasciola gigantica TaxID=46835 RepID=A0A504Z7M7_FASGI|nr:Peroxiredoxin Prx4 [Fasciola gigantica]